MHERSYIIYTMGKRGLHMHIESMAFNNIALDWKAILNIVDVVQRYTRLLIVYALARHLHYSFHTWCSMMHLTSMPNEQRTMFVEKLQNYLTSNSIINYFIQNSIGYFRSLWNLVNSHYLINLFFLAKWESSDLGR